MESTEVTFRIPAEYRENEALEYLGALQDSIADTTISSIAIDFTKTIWADPLPLLMLMLSLTQHAHENLKFRVNLGTHAHGASAPHRTFLKYLASQGFLDCFPASAAIRVDRKDWSDRRALRDKLSSTSDELRHRNSDCIHAELIDLSKTPGGDDAFHALVERLVAQAAQRALQPLFGGNPRVRDVAFQKLRKLIFELLLNVAEHAYATSDRRWAGIYARVRLKRPPIEHETTDWNELVKHDREIFGYRQFAPNPGADWLEVFVCDVGCGLTSQLHEWDVPIERPDLIKMIEAARKSLYPLESLAPRLFREPFSRLPRHDASRSSVTGLQELGHVLGLGEDYARVYSDSGTWIGGWFPWKVATHGSVKNLNRDRRGLVHAAGTGYHCCIQPPHRNLEFKEPTWVAATQSHRQAILAGLMSQRAASPPGQLVWCDLRHEGPPSDEALAEAIDGGVDVLAVRLTRLMSKQDIARWISLVAGSRGKEPQLSVGMLLLGEVTPFQALALHEFLRTISVWIDSDVRVLLVSEGWFASALHTTAGSARFVEDTDCSERFFRFDQPETTFNAKHLALLLRQFDSEIFWSSLDEHALFQAARIEWSDGVELERYLDLVQALSDPRCYRAAKRALRRTMELYTELVPVAADELVRSLVADAYASSYARSVSPDAKREDHLLVGSVSVTFDSVGKHRCRRDLKIREVIHLFVHTENSLRNSHREASALLWISELPEDARHVVSTSSDRSGQHCWKRIPYTPFISEHGDKSLSILRYPRDHTGGLRFEDSYYGQTPHQMYRDFSRHKVMGLGHWAQGNRHDLLTLNVRQAYEFSYLENGHLKHWMLEKFRHFFLTTDPNRFLPASILVYPSHSVTDALIARIKDDPEFKDCVPPGIPFIPIKLIGRRSSSPFLFSPTVESHVRKVVPRSEFWSAVIFDDGTVTGKHLRELKEYLITLGARRVYSLVILDRTGRPAHEGVIEHYQEQNPRFWRWDIPGLGAARNCVLCNALSIAQTYAHRLPSSIQSSRLRSVIETWKPRSVDRDWHTSRIESTQFKKPVRVTFGVYNDQSGVAQENPLFLNDSTAVASVSIELTRLTTRSDVALSKAQLIGDKSVNAAAEIVACQLLLFLDEFDYWKKRERYQFLLKTIWEAWPESAVTGLVPLCFALLDHELLDDVWTDCHSNLLRKHVCRNSDALIATNILLHRREFIRNKSYELADDATAEEEQNYVLLGRGELPSILGRFVSLVGSPSAACSVSSHVGVFLGTLDKLIKGMSDAKTAHRDLAFVQQQAKEMGEVVDALVGERVVLVESDRERCISKINAVCDAISHLVDLSGTELLTRLNTDVSPHLSELRDLAFGNNSPDVLSAKVYTSLAKEIARGTLIVELLNDEMRQVLDRWEDTVTSKQYILGLDSWSRKPRIRCAVESKWTRGMTVYWDRNVKSVLRDIMNNVLYRSKEIENPWLPSGSSRKADLWWNVSMKENKMLIIAFENATASRSFLLKYTPSQAGLERVGGSIDRLEFRSEGTVRISVRIPLFTSFSKGDRQ